jgi:hypothetical protein
MLKAVQVSHQERRNASEYIDMGTWLLHQDWAGHSRHLYSNT